MTPTLKQARLQAGYDLETVADKTGLTVATVADYEADSSNIDWLALEKLCHLYRTHPNNVRLGVETEKHALSGA